MENPIDYVAGLSLTFEQANLDFARQFAELFSQVGDGETSALLDRIYRDEIGHVAYGLKWFRRWKNPQESDWEAFCRQLKFPLSPQRAKGLVFNVGGRQTAGFTTDFIAKLDVYAQSRGRTPGVFVFNPLAEGPIALGDRFAPIQHQRQLEQDLANLPQFLCRQDDIVLVPERPPVEFLRTIKHAGFALPEFVSLADSADQFAGRKLGRLCPWAWGPDSMKLLAPLLPHLTGSGTRALTRFDASIARLYSKAWSAEFLREILAEFPATAWLSPLEVAGVEVRTLDEALATVCAIRDRGHHRVVVKEAIGLAGHNAIRLWEPEVLDSQRAWMTRALQAGQTLVVEPWLDRTLDFSVQYEMTSRGLKVRGYTGLINDQRGQFMANWAAPHCRTKLPAAVAQQLAGPPDVAVRVRQLFEVIRVRLEAKLCTAGFLGPLGIDALLYRSPDGAVRVKPVVEINPRYTMGRVTLELMQQAVSGRFGLFHLVNRRALRAAGAPDLASHAQQLTERFPLRLAGEPKPRIDEGVLVLNDPARAQAVVATFQVARSLLVLLETVRPACGPK